MTPPVLLKSSERDARAQHNMEDLVRRMLRRSADSYRLSAFPLAQALCRASGIPNAQQALRHVVDAAFVNAPHEAHLRDLIVTSDLDAHLSRTESAVRMQVSRRHLQRYRAQAVGILARHIRELVGSTALVASEGDILADPVNVLAEMTWNFEPQMAVRLAHLGTPAAGTDISILELRSRVEAGHDVSEIASPQARSHPARSLRAVLLAQSKQLNGNQSEARESLRPILIGRERDLAYDAETLFELERLAFLRARHAGDACEALRVAGNMRRIAQDRAIWRSQAMLAQAEAQVRLGRIHDAGELLDAAERLNLKAYAVGQIAATTALRAEIALLQGDAVSAERLACGAYLVLRKRHYDAYGCLTTIARARLRAGKPWTCPDHLGPLARSAWDRIRIDIESCRHILDDGFRQQAAARSEAAYRISLKCGYEGLAARAAATIGASFPAASPARRLWSVKSLGHLLNTRDHLAACDLLPAPQGGASEPFPGLFAAESGKVLRAGLTRTIPQLAVEADAAEAVETFLRQLVLCVVGQAESPALLWNAAEELDRRAPDFPRFLDRFRDAAFDVMRPFFWATTPPSQRDTCALRLSEALAALKTCVKPSVERQFLVG